MPPLMPVMMDDETRNNVWVALANHINRTPVPKEDDLQHDAESGYRSWAEAHRENLFDVPTAFLNGLSQKEKDLEATQKLAAMLGEYEALRQIAMNRYHDTPEEKTAFDTEVKDRMERLTGQEGLRKCLDDFTAATGFSHVGENGYKTMSVMCDQLDAANTEIQDIAITAYNQQTQTLSGDIRLQMNHVENYRDITNTYKDKVSKVIENIGNPEALRQEQAELEQKLASNNQKLASTEEEYRQLHRRFQALTADEFGQDYDKRLAWANLNVHHDNAVVESAKEYTQNKVVKMEAQDRLKALETERNNIAAHYPIAEGKPVTSLYLRQLQRDAIDIMIPEEIREDFRKLNGEVVHNQEERGRLHNETLSLNQEDFRTVVIALNKDFPEETFQAMLKVDQETRGEQNMKDMTRAFEVMGNYLRISKQLHPAVPGTPEQGLTQLVKLEKELYGDPEKPTFNLPVDINRKLEGLLVTQGQELANRFTQGNMAPHVAQIAAYEKAMKRMGEDEKRMQELEQSLPKARAAYKEAADKEDELLENAISVDEKAKGLAGEAREKSSQYAETILSLNQLAPRYKELKAQRDALTKENEGMETRKQEIEAALHALEVARREGNVYQNTTEMMRNSMNQFNRDQKLVDRPEMPDTRMEQLRTQAAGFFSHRADLQGSHTNSEEYNRMITAVQNFNDENAPGTPGDKMKAIEDASREYLNLKGSRSWSLLGNRRQTRLNYARTLLQWAKDKQKLFYDGDKELTVDGEKIPVRKGELKRLHTLPQRDRDALAQLRSKTVEQHFPTTDEMVEQVAREHQEKLQNAEVRVAPAQPQPIQAEQPGSDALRAARARVEENRSEQPAQPVQSSKKKL